MNIKILFVSAWRCLRRSRNPKKRPCVHLQHDQLQIFQFWLRSKSKDAHPPQRLLPRQTEESVDCDCSTMVQSPLQSSPIVCQGKAERPSIYSEHPTGDFHLFQLQGTLWNEYQKNTGCPQKKFHLLLQSQLASETILGDTLYE